MAGRSSDRLPRELSLTDAVLLIVASVVGAGIFFTPGRVAELLPAPEWILAAWVVGGLLSLAGALANAELGAMFPCAGGDYVYLREAFHPLAGFLVGWLTFFAIYAGTIAALAAAFASGCVGLFGLEAAWEWPLALATTAGLSALNYIGVRWGALANKVTSTLKLLALGAFSVAGPLWGDGDAARLWPGSGVAPGWSPGAAAFGLAMSPILFSYLGWNASIYVGSEIRDPERNVPRSLFIGLGLCGALYLLVNSVYLYAVPVADMRGVGDAGQVAARALFGPSGGTWVAVFALVSVLGTLNATVLVGPRIAYAMALDGLFFSPAGRVSPVFQTPHAAIVIQGGVAFLLLVLLRSFPSALDFTAFAILLATIADVAALYRLRRTRPGQARPYRAWGYPWVPGLYLLANAAIIVSLVVGRPWECAVGLGTLIAGLPLYALFSGPLRADESG